MKRSKVMIAGDMHAPWTSKPALQFFFDAVEREKPDIIVQEGDMYDLFSYSRFPGTRNLITPDDEIVQARMLAEEFWKHLKRIAPQATRYQILGNHDIRPFKYCLENAPFLESFVKSGMKEIFKFDGVETIDYDADDLIIDGNVYIHGHTKHGFHMQEYLANTVLGHTHTGGVVMKRFFRRGNEKILWELNVGYMGDPGSKCFSYKKKTFPWTQGYGIVTRANVPIFVPFRPRRAKSDDVG